ncbi:hypothetical protein [Thalassoglobus polymorphus]|uniref:Uncharacterized protein n=1 Tax=Thalassoglobus polymorphus TaxID=2527994 RepID=A0A517QL61_9PLAN|nr:hypothetical protein [Thalassoglobus polymorphus]QDT32382.1 hypothetical protein Mal48_16280 [Thalassoglobus polymorphus]
MTELEGHWQLVGYEHLVDEILYEEGAADPRITELYGWLLGRSDVNSLPSLESQAGLVLRICDSKFEEEVTGFERLMFDADGIQVNDYRPMTGVVYQRERISFIKPFDAFVQSDVERFPKLILRYDDGDTQVCDSLRRFEEKLIRQVSVVTDEIYLERILMVYSRYLE